MVDGEAVGLWTGVAGLAVAAGALVVSLRAARDAREAPLNHAQREIRSQVREHAQSLLTSLGKASTALRHGEDLGPLPESLVAARLALRLLTPRLRADAQRLELAAMLVMAVEVSWAALAHDEQSLTRAEGRVQSAEAHARRQAEHGPAASQAAQEDVSRARAEVTSGNVLAQIGECRFARTSTRPPWLSRT